MITCEYTFRYPTLTHTPLQYLHDYCVSVSYRSLAEVFMNSRTHSSVSLMAMRIPFIKLASDCGHSLAYACFYESLKTIHNMTQP